jgi:hypothetical protein
MLFERLESRRLLSANLPELPGVPAYGNLAVVDLAADPARAVPLRLSGSGAIEGNPFAGATFSASGTGTHLGRWTNEGNLLFTLTPDGIVASGDVVFTAANGDNLTADIDGTFDPATGTGTATFTWTGGSGRFEGAEGSASFIVNQSPDGSFSFVSRGTLIV